MPCQRWVGGKPLTRQDDDPPFHGCLRTCLHRQSVENYQAARQADLERVERNAGSRTQHPTEWADEVAARPPMTLRRWLEGQRTDQEKPR